MRAALSRFWQRLLARAGAKPGWPPAYEALYERHARRGSAEAAAGDGDFELVGRLELALLVSEGLRPGDTLVDFGCGSGRLAVHAVPYLAAGQYVGIDIARAMLEDARRRLAARVPSPTCGVRFVHQTTPAFPLPDAGADVICAFSVFTHMEHEDAYRYLVEARRVVRPGGRLVLSCLPLDQIELAREVFRRSARRDLAGRWSTVRDVVTSTDLLEAIARMAGWSPLAWRRGDAPGLRLPGDDRDLAFGQSVCTLAPAARAG